MKIFRLLGESIPTLLFFISWALLTQWFIALKEERRGPTSIEPVSNSLHVVRVALEENNLSRYKALTDGDRSRYHCLTRSREALVALQRRVRDAREDILATL